MNTIPQMIDPNNFATRSRIFRAQIAKATHTTLMAACFAAFGLSVASVAISLIQTMAAPSCFAMGC